MLVALYTIYLTKYINFTIIMKVKCTQNVLHGKLDNVGNVKNKVKLTRRLTMLL